LRQREREQSAESERLGELVAQFDCHVAFSRKRAFCCAYASFLALAWRKLAKSAIGLHARKCDALRLSLRKRYYWFRAVVW
jgi:hypothetical protein